MEVVLPEVTDVGVYTGRTQSMQTQKGLVQSLLLEKGSFHSILGFTPLILRCFCMSRERAQPHWFCIFKRRCVPSCFSLTNLHKKKNVAHILQNHIVLVKIEAKREVGVGDPQMHVDQEVEGRLHLSNNSDESGSSRLIGNKELRLKKWSLVPVITDS